MSANDMMQVGQNVGLALGSFRIEGSDNNANWQLVKDCHDAGFNFSFPRLEELADKFTAESYAVAGHAERAPELVPETPAPGVRLNTDYGL